MRLRTTGAVPDAGIPSAITQSVAGGVPLRSVCDGGPGCGRNLVAASMQAHPRRCFHLTDVMTVLKIKWAIYTCWCLAPNRFQLTFIPYKLVSFLPRVAKQWPHFGHVNMSDRWCFKTHYYAVKLGGWRLMSVFIDAKPHDLLMCVIMATCVYAARQWEVLKLSEGVFTTHQI